jgi:tetratricopeptide (TPR) repeat protein
MASFCLRPSVCAVLAAALTVGAGFAVRAEDQTLLRAREGAAAMIRGQFDKAIALYDQALATPDISKFVQASIYSDRGVAKWRLKQTKAAIDDFNQSIQLSPENAIVYNNRGNALMDLGHPEEAVKDFDRAITLSPNYGVAYTNRGNAHAALGKNDAAFQDFRKSAELMPQSAVPFNGRGEMNARLKRYHAAVHDLTRAISLDSKYEAAYRNRAKANFVVGDYDEAADDVTQALALEPNQPQQPQLLLLRGRAYAAQNKYKEALADFDQAIQLNPNLVDAYVERGIVFTDNHRFDDAIGDFTRAIQMASNDAKAYALRAEAKLQADNADDALSDVNQALVLSLDDPLALRIRGNIYEAQERVDDAIVDYRKALEKDPFQTESREALARLNQDVPVAVGQPLGPAVAGWVITEPAPGRYVASNPDYASLSADLEMYGSGQPKILEWKLMKGALSGIGLLKYYAGSLGQGEALEYVAIIDTRANKVVSIEPQSWGSKMAQWNWQAVSVVVTDPDGQSNEIMLGHVRRRPTAVARDNDDNFFGFQPPTNRRRPRRGGGGGGGGIFNWLFR